VALRCPNGVLVSHSLPAGRTMNLFDPARLERPQYDAADLQPGGSVHSLLWGRDTCLQNVEDFLRKMGAELLVSGHIASETGYVVPNTRQVIVDCSENPAGFVHFPADRPLTHGELVGCIRVF
jgi:hypothetical protein